MFDDAQAIRGSAQEEFPQHFPASGWVEHDPEDIWRTTLDTARGALAKAGLDASDIAAIGITNQRETTLVWDRAHRQADPPRHRLAGPPHRRHLRARCKARAPSRW